MSSRPSTSANTAIVLWAVLGVIALLSQAIVRLLPRALEPVLDGSLGALGILAYVASIVAFAYSEGHRGFAQRFSPRVVVRALKLAERRGWLIAIAPLMAMGLVHGTRRRLIGSWVLLGGIVTLVLLVRLLPQPWRGAVDAGVVVGLSWGVIATLVLMIKALRGQVPDTDPELPARA
ncbi:hypothetical protein [Enhygromyxa salina]|uniref:hypothetical protein n=1 Tax=Enhygromyxa salina TaxID=215803 RepID=UPI0015E5A155|nr:hypothetical protein [Enhygromyxa salina]